VVVILTIPAGFGETTERIYVAGAKNAKQATTAALAQFPPEKRDRIKAEVEK